MQLLTPTHWQDYELLDCGDFEKLERFGPYITIRPEPQAEWPKKYPPNEWEWQAHVRFISHTLSSGEWRKLKQMPDKWTMQYALPTEYGVQEITFRLGLTAFKHVGVFPEQACNWDILYPVLSGMQKPKFLNLFAYTGGASLVARAAGADVTHVDSIRQVVNWANENMQLSHLDNIRWMIDDARKFVKKEQRRGHLYQGIVLDPPAYGHGPNGEKWKLENDIADMMADVLQILDPTHHILILNAYALGFSASIPHTLLQPFARQYHSDLQTGELYLKAKSGVHLPLGVWGRLEKK